MELFQHRSVNARSVQRHAEQSVLIRVVTVNERLEMLVADMLALDKVLFHLFDCPSSCFEENVRDHASSASDHRVIERNLLKVRRFDVLVVSLYKPNGFVKLLDEAQTSAQHIDNLYRVIVSFGCFESGALVYKLKSVF